MKTNKELAMEWWNGLFGSGMQIEYCDKYYPHYLTDSDIYSTMSDDEIELVWRKEVFGVE